MIDEEIAQLIYKEFTEKTLGVTEQYLEIHEPVYVNGLPKIDRIDREEADGTIIAYLPVKDEHFSFAVYIDTEKREIYIIGTESRNIVSLRATSETLSSSDLLSFVNFPATKTYNKGDLKPNRKSMHKFSFVEYEPNPEPDEFEDKLKKLLVYLKTDENGVQKLAINSNAFVFICMDFHYGNQMLGGANLDLDHIKTLAELNLRVVFDFNAWGKQFK